MSTPLLTFNKSIVTDIVESPPLQPWNPFYFPSYLSDLPGMVTGLDLAFTRTHLLS